MAPYGEEADPYGAKGEDKDASRYDDKAGFRGKDTRHDSYQRGGGQSSYGGRGGYGGQGERTATGRLYVGNLNYETTEDMLYNYFYEYGDVEYLRIATGREHRSLGWGTVQYHYDQDAEEAIKHMNGFEVDGRKIIVKFDEKSQQQHQNQHHQHDGYGGGGGRGGGYSQNHRSGGGSYGGGNRGGGRQDHYSGGGGYGRKY